MKIPSPPLSIGLDLVVTSTFVVVAGALFLLNEPEAPPEDLATAIPDESTVRKSTAPESTNPVPQDRWQEAFRAANSEVAEKLQGSMHSRVLFSRIGHGGAEALFTIEMESESVDGRYPFTVIQTLPGNEKGNEYASGFYQIEDRAVYLVEASDRNPVLAAEHSLLRGISSHARGDFLAAAGEIQLMPQAVQQDDIVLGSDPVVIEQFPVIEPEITVMELEVSSAVREVGLDVETATQRSLKRFSRAIQLPAKYEIEIQSYEDEGRRHFTLYEHDRFGKSREAVVQGYYLRQERAVYLLDERDEQYVLAKNHSMVLASAES